MTNKEVLKILYKYIIKLSSLDIELAKKRTLEIISICKKKRKFIKQLLNMSATNYTQLKHNALLIVGKIKQ